MRGKKIFCIYGCFNISCYINGCRKSHFLKNTIEFLDTFAFINNTHWQSSKIFNIFVQVLYYIVISDTLLASFLDMLFLLLTVILSELHENARRKEIELQKKVHRRICVRDITFLSARSPFYVFLLFSSSSLSPFASDTMAAIKIHVLLWVVLCVVMSWVNGQKYGNL